MRQSLKPQVVLAPQLPPITVKPESGLGGELCRQRINASILDASVRDQQQATIAATHARMLRKAEWTTNATAAIQTAVKEQGGSMNVKLKRAGDQTIVITGATSGIGLVTARTAAKRGAKLVLIARNEDALRQLAEEINASGGEAIYAVADVADEEALKRAAQTAKDRFGGFDTWINNAGASLYGRTMEVPIDDLRRVFETNVWGVVNGSRVAVEALRERGGALINIGSETSDAAVPLLGIYSASKHAVKGFTDSLRMELEADNIPISVTLIKPTAIHTPFPQNAKSYLPYEPQLPPPVYAPELVAEAILHCAEHPTREFFVGGMAKVHSSMALNAARLHEKMNESMIDSAQNSGEPAPPNRPDGLHTTNSNLDERGVQDRFVLEHSLYQQAKLHPAITATLAIAGGVALAAWLGSKAPQLRAGANAM